MSTTRRPSAALLLLGLMVSVVSGCGVAAGTQGAPSTAAQVGEVTISVDEVDGVTADLCTLSSEREEFSEGVQARGAARRNVVEGLIIRAAVSQVLDETGTELGADYDEALALSRDQAAELGLDDEQAETFETVNEIGAYINSGVAAVGEEALVAWFRDHEITVNPLFGLAVDDEGALVDAETGLSVPVSDVALAAEEPDSDFLATLPDAQLCG